MSASVMHQEHTAMLQYDRQKSKASYNRQRCSTSSVQEARRQEFVFPDLYGIVEMSPTV